MRRRASRPVSPLMLVMVSMVGVLILRLSVIGEVPRHTGGGGPQSRCFDVGGIRLRLSSPATPPATGEEMKPPSKAGRKSKSNVLAAVDLDLGAADVALRPSHRKWMTSATSSGVPRRRIGICSSTILSVPGDRIEVSISPGAMALTRMPRPRNRAPSRASGGQRRLRGGVGRPAKGWTRLPAIEGDVDHGALCADSSSIRPRASATGAKKLTLKTLRHRSNGVSMAPSRSPFLFLGEIAALLTRASSLPAGDAGADLLDAAAEIDRVGEIHLDGSRRLGHGQSALKAGATR